MNGLMKNSLLSAAAALLLFAPHVSAQLSPVPMLTRTICAEKECETTERYARLVAPALSSNVVENTLLVDGEDPAAPCLDRLDRDNPETIGKCIQRKLDRREVAEALAAEGRDLYMVLVLRKDRKQAVHGMAVFVSSNRKTHLAYTHLSPMVVRPDGRVEYTTTELAVPGAPVIISVNGLSEWATMYGVASFPPHRPILEHTSPLVTGTYWGSALATLE